MTGMDDLVTWLRAQLDEDERVARDASAGGRWRYSDGDSVGAWTLYDEHWAIAGLTTYDTESYNYAERMPAVRSPGYVNADANGAHIARWDPARVLAEVDAKRRILDWLILIEQHLRENDIYDMDIEPQLKALALPYADQPGYLEEWRP
jgi:hypothetical protein